METQNHWFTYDEKMSVESTVQGVCDLALDFGRGKMARPYGVALLVAGVDENGPVLYHSDPSGMYTRFQAKAIGAGSEGAQTTLQDQYHASMTLAEAKKLALEILKQVMEEKVNAVNVELAVVTTEEAEFRICESSEVEAIIGTLEELVI